MSGTATAWCCCQCLQVEDEARTPLLSGQHAVTKQPIHTTGHITYSDTHVKTPPSPKSARRFKSPGNGKTEESLNASTLKELDMRPVRVKGVDKRLQDHAKLYNEHLGRWQGLQEAMECFKVDFQTDGGDIPLIQCFRIIKRICDEANVSVKAQRKFQYCIEVDYDPQEMPPSAIPALLAFNKANKLIKEITDKGAPMVKSIDMVISSDKELRREVLVASLGDQGPDSMRHLLENIAELKKVAHYVELVRKESVALFKELQEGVQILLTDEGGSESERNGTVTGKEQTVVKT